MDIRGWKKAGIPETMRYFLRGLDEATRQMSPDINQKWLSHRSGITQGTLSHLLLGNKTLTDRRKDELAAAINKTPSELIDIGRRAFELDEAGRIIIADQRLSLIDVQQVVGELDGGGNENIIASHDIRQRGARPREAIADLGLELSAIRRPAAPQATARSTADLARKALDVLESGTIYSQALSHNIDAFHRAILQEQELARMRRRMDALERTVEKLQETVAHGGSQRAANGA